MKALLSLEDAVADSQSSLSYRKLHTKPFIASIKQYAMHAYLVTVSYHDDDDN
jgi:hypothetical protein